MKHVLLYRNNNTYDEKRFIEFLELNHIAYTFLEDADLNKTVKSLFTEKKEETICKKYSFNFILFKEFPKEEVASFLNILKQLNVPYSHKAMLTETNKEWILQDLLEEISEEHEFFISYNKVRELLKEANSLNFEEYIEESFKPYKDAFMQAYVYIQSKNIDKNTLDFHIENIENTKKEIQKK